jgi:hypothetical protein
MSPSDRKRKRARSRKPKAQPPQLALSIAEFCAAHGLSEALYFKLKHKAVVRARCVSAAGV